MIGFVTYLHKYIITGWPSDKANLSCEHILYSKIRNFTLVTSEDDSVWIYTYSPKLWLKSHNALLCIWLSHF